MKKIRLIFMRGIQFVQKNPQIIYTLFLVLVIPVGFLFSSEQFLRVARDNQDRLEQSRIGLLQEVFVLFAAEKISQQDILNQQIRQIGSKNKSMTTFEVIHKQKDGTYLIYASLDQNVIGTYVDPNPITALLINSATGNIDESYTAKYFDRDIRYWRSVRAISDPQTGFILGYVLTDISMEVTDELQGANVLSAYLVLTLIIILIILLLARQARIIDYATLYQRLKEVDKMKDDFVSMAAHELRSPLMIIRGYADELRTIENINEKGLKYIGNIEIAANQLNTLVADILDVAKLQDGCLSFHFEQVDVSEQIMGIVQSFVRPASDKGLTISCETSPLPAISIDVDRFRQVMVNFIGNAIKYTPSGGVRVITTTKENNVIIRISDTGMGISAENQKKIFQKFFRIKNEKTSGITGTGLGLWITHEIVKSMRGIISVESIEGKGTDFILIFPIAKN